MAPLHRWLPPVLALAITGGAVAWALTGLPGTAAACPVQGCDCEAAGPGPIHQPANAWSSLSLAAAGTLLLLFPAATAGKAFPPGAAKGAWRPRLALPLASWAMVFAGTAAFLFHAGLTAWAARVDGMAVGVLIAALALDGLSRRPGGAPGRLAPALLPWLVLALGGLLWLLGRSGGPWCRPDSLLQAHAAWHLTAAAALFWWLRRRPSSPRFPHSGAPSTLAASGRGT